MRALYIGRRLRLNKAVPLVAMGGDRSRGGIAPLTFKLGSRRIELSDCLPEKKAGFVCLVGAGAGLNILEDR